MKCFASIVLLVASVIATVSARKEVARPKINNCYYALYDDNRATLTSCTKDVDSFTIPAKVTYQQKSYDVTIIQANAFNGRNINTISVASGNKALLLRRNAFNGISYLRQFKFNSKKTEPEIDAFPRNGILTQFSGKGIPYAMEKLIPKYLKKWKLPVGRNYATATAHDIINDLFLLAKNYQRNFGVYDKSQSLNNAADLAFNGVGNVEAYPRLYRAMAIMMGIPENEIIVGHDTIHLCWVYVKVPKYNSTKKWYVIDPSKHIEDNVVYDSTVLQNEGNFINNTLKPFYGSSFTLAPHSFIVYRNKYNYPNESSPSPVTMNFDTWISQNGGGSRTL